MAVLNPKRLLTVDEFLEMARSGLFAEDARLELIEGEIIEMAPLGKRHAGCVRRLNQLLNSRLATLAVVDIQNAAWINEHSFFFPDALLLPQGFLEDEYPTPQDIHLVIEVADSSLRDDRRLKMPVYARVGVPEAWLIAIKEGTKEGTVYVYRQPSPQGYQEVREYRSGDEISPEAFPDVHFPVDSILV